MAKVTLKRLEDQESWNKPFLKNGEFFDYTSFCPLPTEFGVMHGHFEMFCENGKKFNAKISPFRLTVPFSIN